MEALHNKVVRGWDRYQQDQEDLQRRKEEEELRREKQVAEKVEKGGIETMKERFITRNILDSVEDRSKMSVEAMMEENTKILSRLDMKKPLEYESWAGDQEKLKQNRIRILSKDSKWYGSDSSEMVAVKNSISDLNKLLDDNILGSQNQMQDILKTQEAYRKAIDACKYYVENKNPWFEAGRRRLAQVKDLLDQLNEEQKRFNRGLDAMRHRELIIESNSTNDTLEYHLTRAKDVLEFESMIKAEGNFKKLKEYSENNKEDFLKMESDSLADATGLFEDENVKAQINKVAEKYSGNRKLVETSYDRKTTIYTKLAFETQSKEEVRKYYEELKQLSANSDAMEQEVYDIIKENKSKEAADEWLSRVDLLHEQTENERREKRKEFLSPEEYMKHSGEEYKWRMVVFRNPVWGKKSDNIKI
ncbi:MAG: hypothetical protein K5989_12520, partial [Lachnospiraceae bacterium]|nr:hypothetical protein [Lachnospiraceae bacterium]